MLNYSSEKRNRREKEKWNVEIFFSNFFRHEETRYFPFEVADIYVRGISERRRSGISVLRAKFFERVGASVNGTYVGLLRW